MFDQKKIKMYLQDNLSEKRYLHSLRTGETAEKLCLLYGFDPEKGMIAGLIHDIARERDYKEIMLLVENDGYEISDMEMQYPVLLHGRAGAVIAKKEFSINDKEILEAVRWHTTGKSGMDGISSVLYVADNIEPKRKFITDEFRQGIKNKKLEELLLYTVEDSILYCRKMGYIIHDKTIMLYNELKKEG